ncbi:hypothetical protein NUW58_g6185 [Xylaria curta]|uniref:Uncharacterized protein n=1 Tax=Xylaria curta TaxID=42375 RepID=A0ACC1NY53_9PEZI|nr:hypothetical protein NUW58_g6185 [Xylaria curta]
MGSSRLDNFRQFWKNKYKLMSEEHYDEREHYKRVTEAKRQNILDNAQEQWGALYNNSITPPLESDADFNNEARKIEETRDAALKSVKKEFDDHMRTIMRIQRKEVKDHEKAYNEAMTARSFMTASATTTTTSDGTGPIIGAPQTPGTKSVSPAQDRMPPTEDAVPKTTASSEQYQPVPVVPEKHFSCTVQREYTNGQEQYILRYKTENRKAFRKIMESSAGRPLRGETSVDHLTTPVSTVSTTDNSPEAIRTITFDEVYQDGQAE